MVDIVRDKDLLLNEPKKKTRQPNCLPVEYCQKM